MEKFLGENIFQNSNINKSALWFEAEPISPRKGESGNTEGNTKLDLAFGGINKRDGKVGGIEFDPNNDFSWVCFVEAKFLSDCSTNVSYDPFRNQLARIIENLVTFQNTEDNSKYPNPTYFTLLTPRVFKERPFSKLYGYKFFEYHDRQRLQHEFDLCTLNKRNEDRWEYPEGIENRLSILKLNWVTFEEILEAELGLSHLNLIKIDDSTNSQLHKKINPYIIY